MSSSEGDSGPGRREIAYRLFAAEFDDADFSYAESDEERAPNYVVTPTGARVNRMFAVGVLTEVEPVGDDVLRARVVDPTGAFVIYAGQYQPDAQTFLERAQPPTFVAVSGKARTFQPEDSDVVYTSIRPESVNEVDADTRDRWTVQTAEQTLNRIGVAASALDSDLEGEQLRTALESAGVDEALAAGVPLGLDHYGTTGGYLAALRSTAMDAARVVSGDIDEVDSLTISPSGGGAGDLAALKANLDLSSPATTQGDVATEEPTATSPSTDDSRAGTAGTESPESTASADSPDTAPSTEATDTTETPESVETGASPDSTVSAEESETTTESESPADSEPEPTTEPEPETTEPEPTTTAAPSSAEPETDTEPTTDTPTESAADATETAPDTADASDDDIGDFEPGEFDLDEETREEVEQEYGTEFQSGSEVDDAGEADIDTPDPEDLQETAPTETDVGDTTDKPSGSDTTSDAVTETPETDTDAGAAETTPESSESTTEAETEASEPAVEEDTEPAADINPEDAVMEAMNDLDTGDGVDRDTLVETVVSEYGLSADEVEDGIQSALMDGRCYEPDDNTLKSI